MKKSLLFTCLTVFSIINAHIYKIDFWTNGDQNLFLLSDDHVSNKKENQVCNKQRYDILKWAKILYAHIVVEDIFISRPSAFAKNPLQYDYNNKNLSLNSFLFKA